MAANEHKNLSSINRHNPKGFETATNDTVLSKDGGTSSTGTDGSLVWLAKSTIKTTVNEFKGYSTVNGSTYESAVAFTDGQSPFEHNDDYGSGTVGAATMDVSDLFKSGGYIVPSNCTVKNIRGWMSLNTSGNTATLAICKVTPADGVASALTPALIKEMTITGASGGLDGLKQLSATTFDLSSLAAGDIVFTMIKGNTNGNVAYFNTTVEFAYDN